MKDAQDPTRIISGVSDYQDRPLYSILAHFISQLWDLSNLPTRNFLVIGNSGLSFNYKSDVYVAFVLINLTLLLLTVWLALKICSEIFMLVEMPEINQRIVQITFVFLVTLNEVTKTFFWTPHTQIPNLLLPVYCIFLFLNLGKLKLRKYFFVNLFFTAGMLFMYPLLALAFLPLMFTPYKSFRFRLIVVILGFIPYILFPRFIELLGGQYRNIAVQQYREFVWIFDLISGEDPLGPFVGYVTDFTSTLPIFPIIFVVLAIITLVTTSTGQLLKNNHVLFPAFAFGVSYIIATFAIGFYARRLSYGSILYFVLFAYYFLVVRFGKCREFQWFSIALSGFLLISFVGSNGNLV